MSLTALARRLLLAACLSVAACAAVAQSRADSTADGHKFTVPDGFKLEKRGPLTLLTAPEGDAFIAIVDTRAANAEEALAAAWAAYRPEGAKRPVNQVRPEADADGWRERRVHFYETSPNEKADVRAVVRRWSGGWQAAIVEGSDATLEKRRGGINLVFASLRAKDYTRENLAGRTPKPLDAAAIETLKKFVADGAKRIGIPGVGFSIIENNRVVFEGGVGVRALGLPDPVDAHTLFIAASNTKSMTSLLVAQAVDAGLMSWDQPVTEVYPAFKLGNAATTQQLKVKHLVCACTGVPRQDLEWLFGRTKMQPAGVFDMLSGMVPTTKFGEAFQYSNLMVGAAGYVAAARLKPGKEVGAAYDEAMRERIFAPLGMDDTTFDFSRALRGNHAKPHSPDADGKVMPATLAISYTIVPARPAGGVWTSAHDMSRYVLMELGRGQPPGGPRIVSERNLLAREQPQALVGEDTHYGLALFTSRQWGIDVISHGGDLPGFHSQMFWLPQYGLGGTILTNGDPGHMLRGPFIRKLVELVFGGEPQADAQLEAFARGYYEGRRKLRERLELPPSPAVVARLADRYENPGLGPLRIVRSGGEVTVETDAWKAALATRRNDDGTTSLITVSPGLFGLEFVVGAGDAKPPLVLRDSQHEYVFNAR
ncbi:serine hydrolase domain-containing protein [Ramlibacter albus]|uniref:Beta-lactamase family protein n=1 Tax=Ramlibacter albus TaxID=2079448 RepID=A0A923M8R1_9BURK|nr:serine hydrolase domain-containing protein [Ramlibacter albus]MBC5764968.1 beta-lactamase family protein [Ramlibacter albus]